LQFAFESTFFLVVTTNMNLIRMFEKRQIETYLGQVQSRNYWKKNHLNWWWLSSVQYGSMRSISQLEGWVFNPRPLSKLP